MKQVVSVGPPSTGPSHHAAFIRDTQTGSTAYKLTSEGLPYSSEQSESLLAALKGLSQRADGPCEAEPT